MRRTRCFTSTALTSGTKPELPGAPPLIWRLPVAENRRGRVTVTSIYSAYLKKDKKLWVYTPVGFRIPTYSRKESERYRLLVVFDGDPNVTLALGIGATTAIFTL